jgi:uncharacterized protein
MEIVESTLPLTAARYREVLAAGEPWMGRVQKGQRLRIVDAAGCRTVSSLFYRADALEERYSAQSTLRAQGNAYLTNGSTLLSNEGNAMLTIVADTCGRHDTLSGACSAESNTVRHAFEQRYTHNCRDNFLLALAKWGTLYGCGADKRDLSSNVNFFLNAVVGEPPATQSVGGGARYVEMRAEMDLTVLLSACPQLLAAPKDESPAPIELLVWD